MLANTSAHEKESMPLRPIAPAPNVDNIPAELTARRQWVVWRYEWRGTTWTKAPYTPGTASKAASNRRSSWRTFAEAVACYRERRDFFDGIGYMFAKDDPFVGGDFDHCLDATGALSDFARQHLPATYAEISPSGTGIKFIAQGTIARGRKTVRAELYASGRFFTLTGNVVPGQPTTIIEAQAAIDVLLAALPGTAKAVKDGTAGDGDRAKLVQQIADSDWEAARRLLRTQCDRLMGRLRAAAGEATQLVFVLRQDYAGFHQRWPFVGLYRADDTLDNSQVRAVAAYGIKGRGFSFPEYAALMSQLYSAQALAKWGTRQAWREELGALWLAAPDPERGVRKATARPQKPSKVARGRGGNHAVLVENVFNLLLEHRAGTEAIIQMADLAEVIGADRCTIQRILKELRQCERVTTRRFGQYGGRVVTFFGDVIYSEAPRVESPTPPANPAVIYADTSTVDLSVGMPDPNGISSNSLPAEAPIAPSEADVIYSDGAIGASAVVRSDADVIYSGAPGVESLCTSFVGDVIFSEPHGAELRTAALETASQLYNAEETTDKPECVSSDLPRDDHISSAPLPVPDHHRHTGMLPPVGADNCTTSTVRTDTAYEAQAIQATAGNVPRPGSADYSVDCVQYADRRIAWRVWDDSLEHVIREYATAAEARAAANQWGAPEPLQIAPLASTAPVNDPFWDGIEEELANFVPPPDGEPQIRGWWHGERLVQSEAVQERYVAEQRERRAKAPLHQAKLALPTVPTDVWPVEVWGWDGPPVPEC
jgi:hypothetical protein